MRLKISGSLLKLNTHVKINKILCSEQVSHRGASSYGSEVYLNCVACFLRKAVFVSMASVSSLLDWWALLLVIGCNTAPPHQALWPTHKSRFSISRGLNATALLQSNPGSRVTASTAS